MITLNAVIAYFSLHLFVIARTDAKQHKIPNVLVLSLFCGGIVFALSDWGLHSIANALVGATAGALLLPLYVLRVMGAGDVKLMIACGTFLGPFGTIQAIAGAFVLSAIFVSLSWSVKQLRQLRITRHSGTGDTFAAITPKDAFLREKIPFAPAIALAAVVSISIQLGGI